MPTKLSQEDVDRMAEDAHQNQLAEEAYDEEHPGHREVATRPQAALTEPQGISGEFDQSDIALPFAKLLQKTSPETNEGHKAGAFLKLSGEETSAVLFICLHIARSRTFFDGDGGKRLCESIDRRTGHPRDPDFAAELGLNVGESMPCVSCPHVYDPQTEKLACKMDYTLTLYDLETEEPFMFRVRGSAMGRFKQRLVSAVVMGRKPPWFAQFEMTAVLKQNERKQSWFAPELKIIKTNTPEENDGWAAYARQFGAKPSVDADADDLPFE